MATGPFPSVRVTDKPQWSPVLETGNGTAPSSSAYSGGPGRNGARSWRPGMAPHPPDRMGTVRGRNGARSWRPGMGAPPHRHPAVDPQPQWSPVLETGNGALPRGGQPRSGVAAMEPGLGDREWPRHRVNRIPQHQAAMEPGLGDREWTRTHSPPSVVFGVPQWSPVLETGNGGRRSGTSDPAEVGRNGARSWRPGMGTLSSDTGSH